MSEIRDAIRAEFPRLRALWPALHTKPEHLSEIGKALMQHADRLTPEDIARGFDRVVQSSPTTAYPPGPHEVLGCVLAESSARARDRRESERRRRADENLPARNEVAGRSCPKCRGALAFLADDRMLWCDTCRAVVAAGNAHAPRVTLDDYEAERVQIIATDAPSGGAELGRSFLQANAKEDAW